MKRIAPLLALIFLMVVGSAICDHNAAAQSYSLPNDNASCPSGCRQIPWKAGSDLWNGGSLPNYTSVTCTGLAANGTTDDGPAIQACINKAASGTAVFLPAGTYYVNSTIRLISNMVLRGAGTTSTRINLGSSGTLTTQNFSRTSGGLAPPVTYAVDSPGYTIANAPKKGDTTISIGSGSVSAGDWIAVFADNDPSLVSSDGEDGHCSWCGDNTGYRVMQQIVQVTSVSGTTATLSRPLYYTLYTNPQYRKYNFGTKKAGYEDFHVTATGDIGSSQIILLQGCLYCWVKGVETQNTGSNSGSAHIEMDFSYGNEIRDSYCHDQRSGASGSGYGIYMQFTNSDHKIENNIVRHSRHGIIFQGGGSGVAVLYNYVDDGYTDDLTYLASVRASHGAHPYMNLWEGNIISHFASDDFSGTASHQVLFRNWLWGDETGTGVPSLPAVGYDAVDLYPMVNYYSLVGNVLGRTGMHTTWSLANLLGFNEFAVPLAPIVYSLGGASGSLPSPAATTLKHGNWDYKSMGVANWDGGSNHQLPASLYYTGKPGFLSGYSWPLEGPEGNPTTNANPAEKCYLSGPAAGSGFDSAKCYGGSSTSNLPPPPVNVTGTLVK
jgi:hypothetical protein